MLSSVTAGESGSRKLRASGLRGAWGSSSSRHMNDTCVMVDPLPLELSGLGAVWRACSRALSTADGEAHLVLDLLCSCLSRSHSARMGVVLIGCRVAPSPQGSLAV